METVEKVPLPDICLKIQALIEYLGITHNEFGRQVIASGPRVPKILSGAMPTADFLQEIVKVYPFVNPVWLIGNSNEMILEEKPTELVLKDVANEKVAKSKNSEPGMPVIAGDAIKVYLSDPGRKGFLDSLPTVRIPGVTECRAFEVQGDNMTPFLFPGDLAVATPLEREAWQWMRPDELYVVIAEHKGILIQNIENYVKEHGKIVLEPINPLYSSLALETKAIREIWQVEKLVTYKVRPAKGDMNFEARFEKLESQIKELKRTAKMVK